MPNRDVVKQLTDMMIDEISLVDRGANQHAKVLISKRDDNGEEVDKASPTVSSVHHDVPLGTKKRKAKLSNDGGDGVTVTGDEDDDELAKVDDSDDELLALLERLAQQRLARQHQADSDGEEDDTENFDIDNDVFSESDDIESFQSEAGDDPEFGPESDLDIKDVEAPDDEFAPEAGRSDRGDGLLGLDEAEDAPKPMPGDLPEEVAEYVNELERVVDELERRFAEEAREEVGKTDAREEVEIMDDITKSDDDLTQEEISFLEELSKSFEAGEVDADEVVSKALEEVRKAQDEAREARELATAERDARVEREFISKVADDYPHLPVTAQELGPVIKSAKESLSEEHFELLEKALAANEAITKSIASGDVSVFSEVGKRGGSGSADNEIDAQADELVSKGEAKSREEAIAKLYSERPELYDEYLSEHEAQVR